MKREKCHYLEEKRCVMFLLLPRIFRVICSEKLESKLLNPTYQDLLAHPCTRNTQRAGELPKPGGKDQEEYGTTRQEKASLLFTRNSSWGEGMTEHVGGSRQAGLTYEADSGGRKLKFVIHICQRQVNLFPPIYCFCSCQFYKLGICAGSGGFNRFYLLCAFYNNPYFWP